MPKEVDFMLLDEKSGEDGTAPRKSTSQSGSSPPGIIYLSRLPHGFYEKELKGFLSQFGKVTNLRLGRSRRTGGSRGFAFVEFKFVEVANIVCETMNNYLMFDKLVRCKMVNLKGDNNRMWRKRRHAIFRDKVNPDKPPAKRARDLAKIEVNALRTEKQNNRRLKKQLKKLVDVHKKLEEVAGVKSKVDLKSAETLLNGKAVPAKSPLMEVDEEDLDITLKTPPNVRKVKSQSNSAANSRVTTPVTAKTTGVKSSKKQKGLRELAMAQTVSEKLGKTAKNGDSAKPKILTKKKAKVRKSVS